MSSDNHPLPPPPPAQQFPAAHQQQQYAPRAPQQQHQQQQQPQQQQKPQQPQQYQQQQQKQQQGPRPDQQRPRAKSNFSFHSRKSSGSGGAKADYVETHEEKESRRLHTKADPSMALSEAEPSAVASGVKSSLAPIRAMQYRDGQGNPIADPDRSNPTRSRWERPLDTIRSFEAAIDGNYKRQSYMRAETADASTYNRRSSYYGGSQVNANERPRYPHNGYYGGGGGGRSYSHRGEDQYMNHRQSFYNNNNHINNNHNNSDEYGGPSNGYAPNRARYPRTASEPHFSHGQGVYPAPGNQHSYETVTTASGSGSGSSDPAGYSTDPSSENSSVDRITPLPPVKDAGDHHGSNGLHSTSQHPNAGFNQKSMNGQQRQGGNSYQNQGQPQVPRKETNAPRVPMKLGKSSGNVQNERPAVAEKRKSWFGKRFSKA